jgi:hypothetical protein
MPSHEASPVALEVVPYGGWKNCARLSGQGLEAVVTLDVGPRVIRLAVPGGRNVFKEFADEMGKTQGDRWMSFGGHRLWHAPEAYPRTYAPDFSPVEHSFGGGVLRLAQGTEPETGIQKEMELRLQGGAVHVTHRLTNRNPWPIELAPWSLSVMAAGGRALVPQEAFIPHPDALNPARPLVLWHFTRMNDPRFTWGDRLVQVREDASVESKQKIGVCNRQGWAAYAVNGDLFVKSVPWFAGATYPDMGCNCEVFTQPGFLEVETLGPLARLEPGAATEHVERWKVIRGVELPSDERDLVAALNPHLTAFGVSPIAI